MRDRRDFCRITIILNIKETADFFVNIGTLNPCAQSEKWR